MCGLRTESVIGYRVGVSANLKRALKINKHFSTLQATKCPVFKQMQLCSIALKIYLKISFNGSEIFIIKYNYYDY